jgi:hypothetical protein
MPALTLNVLGPFGWPRLEGQAATLPKMPGVYLMTVPHQDGFLPFGVGITRRLLRKRFIEHTRCYLKGEYNILDIESAQAGVREILWQGWGWTPEKRANFEFRKKEIENAARTLMSATRIFVLETGIGPRLLERLEAAIANHYYSQSNTLFDRGMLRMPRWSTEEPLLARLVLAQRIFGLPGALVF